MVDFLIKSPKLTCDFMFKLAPKTGNPQFCIKGISPSGPSSEDTVHVLNLVLILLSNWVYQQGYQRNIFFHSSVFQRCY